MPWAKFDDKLIRNRKVRRVARKEPSAALLWMWAVIYCCEQMTDGEIDGDELRELLPSHHEDYVRLLLTERLLHDLGGDRYRIDEFERYPLYLSGPRPTRRPDGKRRRDWIPTALRLWVYARDGYRCLHCGAADKLTLDHIYPWSLGGSDDADNLQTLCLSCNARKGAKCPT